MQVAPSACESSSSSYRLPAETRAPASAAFDPEGAYQQTLVELAGVSKLRLLPINLDVVLITSRVLGALPGLRALQPELQKQIPHLDGTLVERLRRQAVALQHANALYNMTSSKVPSVAPLADELTALRQQLRSCARDLALHGLMDAEPLERIGRKRGYRALAEEVLTLAALFRQRWPSIVGRTPLPPERLQLAESLAFGLLSALGRRGRAPEAFLQAACTRQQLFTLLVRTYDRLRRAVRYVRLQQRDAEQFAPSLYAGRTGRSEARRTRARQPIARAHEQTPHVGLAPVEIAEPAPDPSRRRGEQAEADPARAELEPHVRREPAPAEAVTQPQRALTENRDREVKGASTKGQRTRGTSNALRRSLFVRARCWSGARSRQNVPHPRLPASPTCPEGLRTELTVRAVEHAPSACPTAPLRSSRALARRAHALPITASAVSSPA